MVAFVVDDEVLAMEHISRLLRKSGLVVYGFTNPKEALENIHINNVDVFYLDIEMPEISGIKFAEAIHEMNLACEVVFTTGHDQYALNAFDVNAIDYLLKPVTPRQLERSVDRLRMRIGKKSFDKSDNAKIKGRVNISLFGKVSMYFGEDNKSLRFMTVKVVEVFCYMLLNKNNEISKWKLIDDIWPSKDVNKGDINMRSTISRLNKNFRDNELKISLKSTRNGYQLECFEDLEVDAFLLEKIADTNYIISEDNLLSFELILLKYNDLFLEDFDNTWCEVYRTLYHRYYKIAAHKLVDYYQKRNQDPLRLLNILEWLIKFEPYDDEMRAMILKLYYNCYGKTKAMEYYQLYTKLLKDDLDTQPTKKVSVFYQTYLR